MRWLFCASLLTTLSCDYVFELAERPIVDEDGDESPDDVDNCKGIANPSQADSDADGRGDACDRCDACLPCDVASDHDEDSDKVIDACDNCPALANLDQANGDADDLGDACDVSDKFERRLMFEGFGELSDEWLEAGAQWIVTDGDVGPLPAVMPGVSKSLQHESVVIPSGTRWVIEVGMVALPLDRKQGFYVGDSAFCFLEHFATGSWQITASETKSAPFAATFDATIRFRMTAAGSLGAQFASCAIPGIATQTDSLWELIYPLSVKLVTFGDGPQFRYVEVIGE